MPNITVPSAKPRLSSAAIKKLILSYPVDRVKYPLIVIGIRGYYLNTLGEPMKNDLNMYDDALFIDSPFATASFNANTDPSKHRKGYGFSDKTKGMGHLKPGLWFAHQFGLHKGKYLALIQTGGKVTVIRDGDPDYEDSGYFGINIHRGGYGTTSSLGCQTIYPPQWDSFIAMAVDHAKRLHGNKWNKVVIPYLLVENTGQF